MNHSWIYLKLVLTTLFWAAVFHVGKYAVALMSPVAVGAWRFIVAAAVLLPLVALREGWSLPAVRRNALALAVMSAVGVFGFNVSLFYGLRLTSAVNGALIMAFNPALTVVLSALINRESVTMRQAAGLLLGLIGVSVVVSKGSWHVLQAMSFSAGDLLVLLGSLGWAIYSVIPKRFVHGLSTMQVTGSTITGGAALMAVCAAATTPDFLQPPALPMAAAIVFMGLFGSVLAYLWWNQAVQKIGAASVAVFINLVPIFTALIGLLLGQSISLAQLCGAALVIAGVLVSSGRFKAIPAVPALAQAQAYR
ncbi:DMT family transporter [Noviherbaspirillum sp.]|uniref:DMT family transporter n=1 Tax=Noviherbaspirillum sp. TaxID=1926288 RepID=UPI002B4A5AA9|nr:DMT family transporter [Noviherbaspirillum sp.]HJV79381.1 DMT family transporter [Noviherbaspirillum sp.]